MNKENFGKNHNKKNRKEKKTMQGNIVAIYSVSWGNLQLLFSTSSILKIIKSIKKILKKIIKQKNQVG